MPLAEGIFFNKLITKSLTINPTDRTFTGLVSVNVVDKDGEIIVIDELMKVLPTWLKRGGFLSDSHSNRILGRGTGFRRLMVKDEDDQEHDAIEMKGYIFDDYELDHDVWDKMKSGEYRGLSFGGATKSDREPTYLPDGRIAYKLKDLEAYEIAICREPANPLALITSINTIAKSSKDINYTKKSDDEICIKCDNVGCYVVKSLIDVTKPFAGYCYSDDTRVLTDNGLKLFGELTKEDKIMTLNHKTEQIEYQFPTEIQKFYYEGDMINFKGKLYDLKVTPEHRLLVRNSQSSTYRDWSLIKAVDLLKFNISNFEFLRTGKWAGSDSDYFDIGLPEYVKQSIKTEENIQHLHKTGLGSILISRDLGISKSLVESRLYYNHKPSYQNLNLTHKFKIDSWVEFMGWYLSEGHIAKNHSTSNIIISQTLIHPTYRGDIIQCIKELGFTPSINDGGIYFTSKILGSYLKQFGHAKDKFIPKILKDLKSEKLQIIIDALVKGDGSRERNYYTISPKLRDDFLEIAIKSGYGVTFSNKQYITKEDNINTIFCIGFNKISSSPRIRTTPIISQYKGFVYCATVPNHVMMIERNGKLTWSGNSNFDACVASNKDKGDPQAYCATIMRSVEGKNKDHPVKNQYNGSLFCLQCGEDPYSKDSKLNQDVEKGAVEDMTHDKCPHCGYIPMDGQDTVQDHMNKEHPSQTINSYNTFDSLGREPKLLDGSPESYRERAGLPQPQPTQQNGNENYNRSESEPSKLPPQMEEIEKNPPTEKKKLFEYGGFSYDHYGSGRDTIRNEDQDLKPGDNTGNEDTTVTKGKIFSKKEVGYVETPVMKSCGTCEYFKSPDVCRLPLDSPVDSVDGCCNFWSQKITIEKGEDGKAKIKLEGEPAERLLEQAGVIPEKVVKAPKPGGWPVKPNANPQPQTSHITVHGSSDTVNDPNPQESPFQIGNVEENNFVAANTTKSDSDNESLCGICGKPSDKHDRDSGHPFKGGDITKDIQSYTKYLQKSEPEKVDVENVINWIKVMNPSQLQHAIDPNNWYDWSEAVSRLTWDEMNEDQKRLLVATYAFRNDGKVVEGIENESMIPKEEGSPQSQVDNIGKTNLHPQADTTNINATPTPMTIGQNTKNPIDPVEDERLERTQKALDSLNLTLVEIKLKKLL